MIKTNARTPEPDGETRRAILRSATRLFIERGYKGVAMRDVADEVGITPAALYYYFADGKEALFAAALLAMLTDWAEGATAALVSQTTLKPRLVALARYMLTLPVHHMPKLMQDVEILLPEEMKRQIFPGPFKGLRRRLTEPFQEAINTGEIRSDIPAEQLATFFVGMLMSNLQGPFQSERPSLPSVDDLSAQIVEVLLHGIAAR